MSQGQLKLWYLKNIRLFKDFSEAELMKFNDKMVMKDYNKKEYLYLAPENLDTVFLVKQGNIEIGYIDESGRELAIDILGAGEIFGAVPGEGYSGGYARAIDRTIVCILNRTEFEHFLELHPQFSLRVMKLLGAKIRVLENKLQNLVFKDVKTRICELLYSLYQKTGDPKTGLIKITLTHQDIANLVGSTRETASVYLSELKKDGIIDYIRKKIKVTAPGALRRLARPVDN